MPDEQERGTHRQRTQERIPEPYRRRQRGQGREHGSRQGRDEHGSCSTHPAMEPFPGKTCSHGARERGNHEHTREARRERGGQSRDRGRRRRRRTGSAVLGKVGRLQRDQLRPNRCAIVRRQRLAHDARNLGPGCAVEKRQAPRPCDVARATHVGIPEPQGDAWRRTARAAQRRDHVVSVDVRPPQLERRTHALEGAGHRLGRLRHDDAGALGARVARPGAMHGQDDGEGAHGETWEHGARSLPAVHDVVAGFRCNSLRASNACVRVASDVASNARRLPRCRRARCLVWTGALPAVCDHLLWGAANLDAGIAALAERTGVRATPGGRHPDLGTHNAIATLGRKRFLEIIAPDPTLPPGALAVRLASMQTPALIMWAARTSSAAGTAARAEAAGYPAAVIDGHRRRPDGAVLRWTNVFVTGHGAGTLVPFFIEWDGLSPPADDGADGLRLRSFRAETPQAEALRAVLNALDVRLSVRQAPASRLVAVLDTPRGRVELAG